MKLLDIIIIAVVEGLTEYLPISSTAHLIFTNKLLHIPEDNFVKVLLISIQLGAILAVVVLYRKKLFDFSRNTLYLKLIVAVIPAVILGTLFHAKIEVLLDQPVYIAILLILGGIVFLFVDNIFSRKVAITEQDITYKQAIIIGCWQCLAMMPGVSRSAASIIGGMQQGLSRTLSAEFSFFLAVPTMCAATCFTLFLKNWNTGESAQKGYEIILHSAANIKMFSIGSLFSFIVAIFAIKLFIGLIQKYGFKVWGWYRITIGIVLLTFIYNELL